MTNTYRIARGINAGTEAEFIPQVQWLPGMGEKRAARCYHGEPVTLVIPPHKVAAAAIRIRTLLAANVLVDLDNPKKETAPVSNPLPVNNPPVTSEAVTAFAETSPDDLDLLRRLLAGKGVSEARVLDLIQQHGGRPAHVTIDLTGPKLEWKGEGLMHYKFPLLMAALAARVNIMLVGPAGSGKTTAASKAAESLGLPFYGTGAISNEFKLTGFIDAQGRIVSTAFRKAFEHGGVFLFDEMDASLPAALLAFNAALANDWMDFPDGCIKRHPDFVVVAGANTFGSGADRQYVGRNQLDAASLDRYAVIDWGYDEALEAALIGAPAPRNAPVPLSIAPISADEAQSKAGQFLERVRKVRAAVTELKVRHVVSPRATINGSKLLSAGWSWSQVEDAVIWKGLDAETKTKVNAKAA
jgi:hypothetical protein